jgi:hypothetical protein
MTRKHETCGLALRRNDNTDRYQRRCFFHPAVWFETLEPRRLMSETSTLGPDGILTIVGSDGVDEIQMWRRRTDGGTTLIVYARAYPSPELAAIGAPARDFDGEFPIAQIRGIRVYGLGGDDLIRVRNTPDGSKPDWDQSAFDDYGRLHIPVTLDGGAGDDELHSQSDADDVIIGGPGRDHSYVADGHDRFAVETIDNDRDVRPYLDADGILQAEIGTFTGNGPEDQLFDDPWLVPNTQGTYTGPNAPDFTLTPDGSGGASTDGSTGGSSGGSELPEASTPLAISSAPLVSTSATNPADKNVWDDSVVNLL